MRVGLPFSAAGSGGAEERRWYSIHALTFNSYRLCWYLVLDGRLFVDIINLSGSCYASQKLSWEGRLQPERKMFSRVKNCGVIIAKKSGKQAQLWQVSSTISGKEPNSDADYF